MKHRMLYDYIDNPGSFWELWYSSGKPEVIIEKISLEYASLIPEDAKIFLDADQINVTLELLDSMKHVTDITCECVYDYEISGYTGNAKIGCMHLTNLKYSKQIPEAEEYSVDVTLYSGWDWPIVRGIPDLDILMVQAESCIKNLKMGFDCSGKSLVFRSIPEFPGCFSIITKYITNFSRVSIQLRSFKRFYKEVPELVTDPSIILCLRVMEEFYPSMLAGKYIANLELFAYDDVYVSRCDTTDLQIGNISRYSPTFEPFIRQITRGKKTKSARK